MRWLLSATMRNPSASMRDRIFPALFASTASGFKMANVFSSNFLPFQNGLEHLAHERGRVDDVNARGLERLELFFRGPFSARDDGPGVPHAAPGRGRTPRDEGDDRLLQVSRDPAGGFL